MHHFCKVFRQAPLKVFWQIPLKVNNIELLYRNKQAKTSRKTSGNCIFTLFTLNCIFTLFTLNCILTLFTLNCIFTLFTLNCICIFWVEPVNPFEKLCVRNICKLAYSSQFKLVAAILPQPVWRYISNWVVVEYSRKRQWVIYTSYVQRGVQVCLIFSKVCNNHDNATRYIIHKQFLEIKLLI